MVSLTVSLSFYGYAKTHDNALYALLRDWMSNYTRKPIETILGAFSFVLEALTTN